MKQCIDTNPAADKVQVSLLRKESIATKFSRVRSLSRITLQLSQRAVARAHKDLTPRQKNLLFLKYCYGDELASRVEKYLSTR